MFVVHLKSETKTTCVYHNAFKDTIYCKIPGKDIKSLSLEEKTPHISNMTKNHIFVFGGVIYRPR